MEQKYFNPGLPETRQFVTNIVKDIVKRYDVDAIHMDDYFILTVLPARDFPMQIPYKNMATGLQRCMAKKQLR